MRGWGLGQAWGPLLPQLLAASQAGPSRAQNSTIQGVVTYTTDALCMSSAENTVLAREVISWLPSSFLAFIVLSTPRLSALLQLYAHGFHHVIM